MSSTFLTKHTALIASLGLAYSDYYISSNEIDMSNGEFPTIGLFLGSSDFANESRTYAPTNYIYVLSVFDIIELDDGEGSMAVQRTTFDQLETIINDNNFKVVTAIEPVTNLATGECAFISGWTTAISFFANN